MAETFMFNALREATDEEMARDPSVCVMGEDVGHYGGSYKVTKDLCKKYGDLRVLDTPARTQNTYEAKHKEIISKPKFAKVVPPFHK